MHSTQIVCLTLIAYLTIIYFCARRTHTYQHTMFKSMIMLTYVNLISEIIKFRGPYEDPSKRLVNPTSNMIFLLSMFAFYYVSFLYVRYLALGNIKSKNKVMMAIPSVVLIVVIFIVPYFANHKEIMLEKTWQFSIQVTPICSIFYMFIAGVYMFRFRNNIDKKARFALALAVSGQVVVAVIQLLYPDEHFSGLGFVLMDFTFYLTVESPDALLIEKLKYESERADEANKAKSAFLANMSHEIRTPMNAVVGMTEILLRTDLDDKQKSYMLNIKHSGNSLLLIINDLLDFSKIEAGKMELVYEEYDPMSVFNDIGMVILNRIGDKPVELEYDIDRRLPARMDGDAGRIKQIIINLLNNAVKFTDEGTVKLACKVLEQTGKTVTLKFDVQDSGQGIKEEDLNKLFDAFKQVDMARNRSKEGTGLGLSICKQLVTLMGGDITVESEYGKGSTFSFTIKQRVILDTPAAMVKGEVYDVEKPILGGCVCSHDSINLQRITSEYNLNYSPVNEDELLTTTANHLFVSEEIYEHHKEELLEMAKRGTDIAVLFNPMKSSYGEDKFTFVPKPLYSYTFCKFMNHEDEVLDYIDPEEIIRFVAPDAHILIVDDTDMNLKVAVGLLSPMNMQIDVARSGKEAIDKCRAKRYHIVFMDHMMPGMDGIEAIKRIREITEFKNYYRTATIVALTANAGAEAREAFAEVGVNEYVTKPIDIKQISATIRHNLPEELIAKTNDADLVKPIKKAMMIPIIKGLDVAEGIKNSGSEELFESLVGDFYTLIDMKSTKLERFLEDNMYHDFTIEVHALKNTARMVGATELSEKFKRLEELGHEERVDEIRELVPEVLKQFREYKDYLKPYAGKNDEAKEEVPSEIIIVALEKVKEGVANFDLDETDEAMKQLETYKIHDSARPLMENLRAYVADVAMEEIVKTANDMIELMKLVK